MEGKGGYLFVSPRRILVVRTRAGTRIERVLTVNVCRRGNYVGMHEDRNVSFYDYVYEVFIGRIMLDRCKFGELIRPSFVDDDDDDEAWLKGAAVRIIFGHRTRVCTIRGTGRRLRRVHNTYALIQR